MRLPPAQAWRRAPRLLLTRRWILFGLLVAALTVTFVELSIWQAHRWDESRAANMVLVQNTRHRPVPVADLLAPGRPVSPAIRWRQVSATGHYDVAHQVLARYRTNNDQQGFWVLTPLVTSDGRVLVVNRGWISAGGNPLAAPQVPAPPTGQVRIVGRVRPDETGRTAQLTPQDGQILYIDSAAIAAPTGHPAYGGFVDLAAQRPTPGAGLVPMSPPAPGFTVQHIIYTVQWNMFAAIAVFGFGYLLLDEAGGGTSLADRTHRRGEPRPRPGPARRAPHRSGAVR